MLTILNFPIRTAIIALSLVSASAITSCSDIEPDIHLAGDGHIRFEVTENSYWNQLKGSRSEMKSPRTVIEMTGGADKLYLIGEQVVGIDSDAPITRAQGTTTSTITDFGVFAAYRLESGNSTDALVADYMNNVEITRDNGWAPVDEYMWPSDGFLHINAYSPYTSATADEGITSLPGSEESGGLTIGYRVPADPVEQHDLMWAKPVDASASPCTLTFDHALTAIRFVAGAKLAPCTVTGITVSGVDGEGTLNLETGEWSDLDGITDYELAPDATLEAEAGSQYVAAETPITSDEETLMLLPQTLPQGATITLTISVNGVESEFTADISGAEWIAGTTMVYRISASAESSDITLEVVDADGNRVDSIVSAYTGGSFAYQVNSYSNDGSTAADEIEWDAELLDESGNPLSALPDWIKNFTESGKGTSALDVATRLREPEFLAMSEHTKALRDAADINTTSGYDTYNLAGNGGGAGVENTANTYIINAPGHYSIPLVYGNAIKNGATNEAAYKSTLSDTRANEKKALFNFINHLGNAITDPYIYNNQDCTPAEAGLVWEERIGTITDVELSADGKSLEFDVPSGFIRQGNAVVAVRDAEGNIMWSWQLWITDYVAGTDLLPVDANGTTGYLYPINIGRIYGGDKTEFEQSRAILRLTQKNVPDGLSPLTVEIPVVQSGTTITTNDCSSFYQWGRKDPMIAAVQSYYNAAGQIMSGEAMPTIAMGSTHKEMVETSILHPDKFITGTDGNLKNLSPFYTNLWDIDNLVSSPQSMQPQNVKTIYDPSPVGAKIPVGNEFRMMTSGTYDSAARTKNFTAADGSTIVLQMFGYRELNGHDILSTGVGEFWTAVSGGGSRSLVYVVNEQTNAVQTNDALYGFSVRPVTE